MTRQAQVVLIVSVAVCVLIALFLTPGIRDGIHSLSMSITAPVRSVSSNVGGAVHNVTGGFTPLDELEQRNAELSRENAELKTRNDQLAQLSDENRRLTELLNFKEASTFELVASRVVGRSLSSWSNTIVIDFGYDSPGWPEDMELTGTSLPVVTARGVVGRTQVIKRFETEVVLITDETCQISATAGTGRARGIVQGMVAVNGGRARCRMSFIPVSEDIAPGEIVATSGLGGTFPPGLNIGIVTEAPPPSPTINFGLYREAMLQPSVDLDDLHEVFVIVGVKKQ